MISLVDIASISAAVVLAALGGDAFLKGVLGIAGWLRLPKLLVATTLAAFATSSPELTVSTIAALEGTPEIGLGDALGSNVVNIALILGLALLFGPIRAQRKELGRDFALALSVPLLTLWLASDGTLSRLDGVFLLLLFCLWMIAIVRDGVQARAAAAPVATPPLPTGALIYGLLGLAALILSGHLFVSGASGIAMAFGIDAYVIGATVVALGTSMPELVTVLISRWRGHDDIGIGTLLGSNLFNGMAIVGVAASIHPIQAPLAEITVTLAFGAAAVLLMIPNRAGLISSSRGIMLLTAYAGFVLTTIIMQGE